MAVTRVHAADPPAASCAGCTERDSFTLKAQNDMQDWGYRIHDFAIAAIASGQHVDTSAEDDLTVAWHKASVASEALSNAGDEAWNRTKDTYVVAEAALASAWARLHAENI
jgi:hypothetical protein